MQMTSPSDANPYFMNGVPELLVLRLLAGREMYGYELVRAIREQTADTVRFGEGVVYPVLHGLVRSGALTSRRMTVAGRDRVYYALTPSGSQRFATLAADWTRLAKTIQQVLLGGQDAAATL
jgi:PadR family transcriptional regulator PadR